MGVIHIRPNYVLVKSDIGDTNTKSGIIVTGNQKIVRVVLGIGEGVKDILPKDKVICKPYGLIAVDESLDEFLSENSDQLNFVHQDDILMVVRNE